MKIPLASIVIPDRQRSDMGDIEKLAESLRENGQITPILVAPENGAYRLVAGHRRTLAAKSNGWEFIEGNDWVVIDKKAIAVADLTPIQLQILEYEENVRRKDIDWKESCLAVAKLHMLKQLEHGFAVAGTSSASAWTERKMADFTGFNRSQVHYMLAIAKELQKDPPSKIHECENYSAAFQFLVRAAEAEVNSEIERRRQLANPPRVVIPEDEDDDPSAAYDLSKTEEAAPDKVVVYIHGYNRAYKDADPGDLANLAHCVVGYEVGVSVLPTLKKDLRPNGFAVLWHMLMDERSVETPLVYMPGMVVWNQVRVATGNQESPWPFVQNYVSGLVVTPVTPVGKRDTYYPSVISAVADSEFLPTAVVEHSITPFTLDGMAVTCIGGVDPVSVAELGRVPIFYEPDKTRFDGMVTRLRTFYEQSIPNVEIRVR